MQSVVAKVEGDLVEIVADGDGTVQEEDWVVGKDDRKLKKVIE